MKNIGVAEILIDSNESMKKEFHKSSCYEFQIFTADTVTTLFNKILNDPSYMIKVKKLQLLSKIAGGRKIAADTIIKVYAGGKDHLIDH
jgi:hypothetical protein